MRSAIISTILLLAIMTRALPQHLKSENAHKKILTPALYATAREQATEKTILHELHLARFSTRCA